MITLNIISPELKKEIKLKNIYRTIKREIILITVFIIFFSAAIISSKFILQSYLKEISEKKIADNETTSQTIQDIDNINRRVSDVSKIQAEDINWLKLLELVSNNTTDGIKYSRVSMDKTNGLTLAGQSKTREGLIGIKKFLEEATYLSDINFPISNLLEKENINFNITAKIKNYDFK